VIGCQERDEPDNDLERQATLSVVEMGSGGGGVCGWEGGSV
jgi:hypothetical protein